MLVVLLQWSGNRVQKTNWIVVPMLTSFILQFLKNLSTSAAIRAPPLVFVPFSGLSSIEYQ